jgi:hypothetical protein
VRELLTISYVPDTPPYTPSLKLLLSQTRVIIIFFSLKVWEVVPMDLLAALQSCVAASPGRVWAATGLPAVPSPVADIDHSGLFLAGHFQFPSPPASQSRLVSLGTE